MTNAKILIGLTDKFDPEVRAMMMAKYSRSYSSIEDRLPDTKESESKHKEALAKYYISWGHKSVGQLGSVDVYFESVSMLAEKAIQDNRLYNGQSCSTRYIDFSNQPMTAPGGIEIKEWQERFRAMYVEALDATKQFLHLKFPYEGQVSEIQYDNTIKARAFDICRGILPAGVHTNVAFIGTFDNINDHFGRMLYHPCDEMRSIASTALSKLSALYPHACIGKDKLYERFSNEFHDIFDHHYQHVDADLSTVVNVLQFDRNNAYQFRNKFELYPRNVSSNFTIRLNSTLDYGSYRDIHRHRNGVITMPILTPKLGFHNFYLDNLPILIKEKLIKLLNEYSIWYHKETDNDVETLQYCTPMGYKVAFNYTCDLNQVIYMLELRSGKTVHQTLRKLMHEWYYLLKDKIDNFTAHVDLDEDNFTLKRGSQVFDKV